MLYFTALRAYITQATGGVIQLLSIMPYALKEKDGMNFYDLMC